MFGKSKVPNSNSETPFHPHALYLMSILRFFLSRRLGRTPTSEGTQVPQKFKLVPKLLGVLQCLLEDSRVYKSADGWSGGERGSPVADSIRIDGCSARGSPTGNLQNVSFQNVTDCGFPSPVSHALQQKSDGTQLSVPWRTFSTAITQINFITLCFRPSSEYLVQEIA